MKHNVEARDTVAARVIISCMVSNFPLATSHIQFADNNSEMRNHRNAELYEMWPVFSAYECICAFASIITWEQNLRVDESLLSYKFAFSRILSHIYSTCEETDSPRVKYPYDSRSG